MLGLIERRREVKAFIDDYNAQDFHGVGRSKWNEYVSCSILPRPLTGGNLGDWVQSYAMQQAVRAISSAEPVFREVQRDALFRSHNGICVMQGWFSQGGLGCLPGVGTLPVWVGTHFTHSLMQRLRLLWKMDGSMKPFEVGCRDKATLEFCKKNGVPSYFSRCLTLTLPHRDDVQMEAKDVYCVDLVRGARELLPEKIRRNAVFFSQRRTGRTNNRLCADGDLSIEGAATLLDMYRKRAGLVITSALHCAAPCCAMGIPVVFLRNGRRGEDRFSVLDGILPYWDLKDLRRGAVDFNPACVDIESLKRDILENLRISIARAQGDESEPVSEIRRRIAEFHV